MRRNRFLTYEASSQCGTIIGMTSNLHSSPQRAYPRYQIFILLFAMTIAFSWARTASAGVMDLYVKEPLDVRGKPAYGSAVLTRLEAGDRVVISPVIYGKYRKVRLPRGDDSIDGYVRSADIVYSLIRERPIEGADDWYPTARVLGIFGVLSFMEKGDEFDFTTTSQVHYSVAEAHGSSNYFGLFFEEPFSRRFTGRAQFSLRKTITEGTAEPLNGAPGQSAPVKRTERFFGLGFSGKYYVLPDSNLWLSGGLEVALHRSTESSVSNTSSIPLNVKESGTLIIPFVSTGLDLDVFKVIRVIPEIRIFIPANASKSAYGLELFLSAGYQL